MTVIDLSHLFDEKTELWPGTEPNKIFRKASIEENGYLDHQFVISGHTATHIDAPAHFLANGRLLDDYPISQFVGQAQVIDVSSSKERKIRLEQPVRVDPDTEFALLHTGWSEQWGTKSYYGEFNYLSEDLAEELSKLQLKGVGIDTPSSDPIDSETFPAHHFLLGAGFILIENLCNLKSLVGRKFLFSCLPLSVKGIEGSPVRAVAIL
jgi:arylformamidase